MSRSPDQGESKPDISPINLTAARIRRTHPAILNKEEVLPGSYRTMDSLPDDVLLRDSTFPRDLDIRQRRAAGRFIKVPQPTKLEG